MLNPYIEYCIAIKKITYLCPKMKRCSKHGGSRENPVFKGVNIDHLNVGEKKYVYVMMHMSALVHTHAKHTHTIKMLAPGGPIASKFYCICATGNYLNLLQ